MISRGAITTACTAVLLAGCPAADSVRDVRPGRWADDPRVADGRAEFSTYDVVLFREGAPRPGRAYAVLVSEDLVPLTLVKADDWRRPGLIRAHKFALHTAVPTGMSQFRESTVVFLEQASYSPMKVSYSSQDFCGLTFEELLRNGRGWTHRWSSYWEQDGGHGERRAPGGIPADALPAWVRALPLRDGTSFSTSIVPTLQGSKAEPPRAVDARVEISGPGTTEVPAGRFETFDVRLRWDDGEARFAVEREFPNRVVAWTDALGQTFRLVKSQREAYWERTAPGDEQLVEP